MKLIKKITVEQKKVKRGQPFKIKVIPNDIPDKEVYIQIDDHWGAQQMIQFDGLSGARIVQVRAFTNDKRFTEVQKVKITVLPEQYEENAGLIRAERQMELPNALRLTLYQPKPVTSSDIRYEWYINGEKTATHPSPVAFFDLSDHINHQQLFTAFDLQVIARKDNGAVAGKYRQFVSLASPYQLIKRQTGILMPPVENDFLLKTILAGYVYYNFEIKNVEDYTLNFTTLQFEFLNNDPGATNTIRVEALPEPFIVPSAGKKTYDGAFKLTKLPDNTGGFIVRLLGASATGIPAKSLAHFEFAVQMTHQHFDLNGKEQVHKWLWEERPWEIVLRNVAREYFQNVQSVQNGTANVTLLKRLFSINFENIKKQWTNTRTILPGIAGVEIKSQEVKALIHEMDTTATSNIAVSQQLYQNLANLQIHAASLNNSRVPREARAQDGTTPELSPESIRALMELDLRAMIPFNGTEDTMQHRDMSKLGQECQPDEETPDEELFCELTVETKDVVIPAKIVNARRGDVILAPGGPAGFIGGLLSSLVPPQWYSHCGIMQENYYKIYHCTGSDDWLKDHADGLDLPFDGEEALPMMGFQVDALQHLWPGTISQTVEEAFNGSELEENGKKYKIHAFNLFNISPDDKHPLMDKEGKPYTWNQGKINFPPLVVTIPPEKEAAYPALRQALRAIADRCLEIKGHYRFYAYSDADIAFNPLYFAPVRQGWWASGSRPLVCSTLIWAAVRELYPNKGILEGQNVVLTEQDLEPEDHERKIKIQVDQVEKEITVTMGAVVDDPVHPGQHLTKDGLYFYDEDERIKAANYLKEKITGDIYKKYDDTPLGIGWGIEMYTGMAEKVSNQLCNIFANDQPSTGSQDWQKPGTGRSVSPDNIRDFWDIPILLPDGSWHGLYGYAEPVKYVPGRIERIRVSRWAKKPPTKGTLLVEVFYNGNIIGDASIFVSGNEYKSKSDGKLEIKLPCGSHRLTVTATVNNKPLAATAEIFQLMPDEERPVQVFLSASKRVLYFFAHAEINDYEPEFWKDDEHAGRDWGTEAKPNFVILDLIANRNVPERRKWVEKVGGEVRLEVEASFTINPDTSITVALMALFFEGASEDTTDLGGKLDLQQFTILPDLPYYESFPPNGQSDFLLWNSEENEPSDYAKFRFWFKNVVGY